MSFHKYRRKFLTPTTVFFLLCLGIFAIYRHILFGDTCYGSEHCLKKFRDETFFMADFVIITTFEIVLLNKYQSQWKRLCMLYLTSIIFLAVVGAQTFFFYQRQGGLCTFLGGRECWAGTFKGVIDGSMFLVFVGHFVYLPVVVPIKWFLQAILFRERQSK